jgi:predicted aldo/keto reductase-like oxidoreductase
MKKRTLGRTNELLSVIGFGGIIVMNETQENANNFVAEAIDRNINYFDIAPTYGNAQERLGPALKPYRDKCFLACKTAERDAKSSEKELYESLDFLKTDHFDLYQFHAICSVEEVEKIFASDGAMETFIKAKEKRLVKYLGFSAHSEEAALLMLDKYDFDTVLFPVSLVVP